VLQRGAAPQGAPVPPRDSLGLVNALGATRFLAFGDSITEGVTSSFDGAVLFSAATAVAYPGQLDALLEASFASQDFTVDNFGAGGEEVINAVASGRLAQALALRRPQGLLLLEGINDLNSGKSVSAVVAALQQMVEVAELYNATVLLGTMFQTCESTDPTTGRFRHNSIELIAPFNSALKAMASGRQNVYVVDIFAVFGNNCGPHGGVGLLGGDGLHPNPNGYSVMAQTFGVAARDRFPVRGSFQ
jgi:lysophospholipase L1-like esterase